MVGEGNLDLLFLTGWISQVEQLWELPAVRRLMERLGVFSRLILFDRRGTGLSDSVGGEYTLEQEARDALAVLDAAGSERAALLTYGLGGPVGAMLAAERPERIGALIMYASIARTVWAPDYDWAMTVEDRTQWTELSVAAWGEVEGPALPVLAPSMADDPALAEWFARLQRLAASPTEARLLLNAAADLDVRDLLPQIRVPTLVMHRAQDISWDPRHSRYLAEHIPGARYVELDGADSFPFVGDSDAILEEVEEFLTGGRGGGEIARALLTVMFTDIVDATARARPSSATAAGATCSRATTRRCARSSSASTAARSRRSAMASWRPSPALRHARCAAPWRSPGRRASSASRCAWASTPASAS